MKKMKITISFLLQQHDDVHENKFIFILTLAMTNL